MRTSSAELLDSQVLAFLREAQDDVVHVAQVDFDCDIYVSGSNSHLLSSDYSTYLSGRHCEIKILPLSFSEFLLFHGFRVGEVERALGGTRKVAFDKRGERYDLSEAFRSYMRYGGFPGLIETGLVQSKVLVTLEGIFSSIVMRDILGRGKRRDEAERIVTDPFLLKKITMFLADNIGSNVSVTSIGNTLAHEGLLEGRGRKGVPSGNTAQAYVNALAEAYVFYGAKRLDIKGKEHLRGGEKFYMVDIGLRNYLLGFRDRDRGHVLENVVYFELLSRGWQVSVGKVGNREIDFIADNGETKVYYQVTESMAGGDVRERELAPLRMVRDNYEKIVLTLNPGLDESYEGIKSVNLIDWLLS